jgi:hypothetical protein
MLDRETAAELIARDELDTVLMAFPDQQGRLVGKRRPTGEAART